MIEKIADDLIGQMTEARLIDKEMEARYVYVFICWIEKFITVGSIIVISLMFHKLLPTIFFLVFFLELRKRTGGYHLDKFYRCYLASIVSYLVIVIISEKLSEHPQWLFAIVLLAITADKLSELSTWYNPEGIFTLSKILVIPRDGDEPEKMIEEILFLSERRDRILVSHEPRVYPDFSATKVRDSLKSGDGKWREFVPDEIVSDLEKISASEQDTSIV